MKNSKSLKIASLTLITLIFVSTSLNCWTWGWGRRPYRRRGSTLAIALGPTISSSRANKISDLRDDLNKVINALNNLSEEVKRIGDRVDEIEGKLEKI